MKSIKQRPLGKKESRLVSDHLPQTKWIARQISRQFSTPINIEDLEQVGVLGLMDAARRYDPQKGGSFKTYAEYRIRGAILDEIRSQDWVPRATRDKAKLVKKVTEQLSQRLSRHPTDREIAYELGMSSDEYFNFIQRANEVEVISITSIVDEKKSLSDLLMDSGVERREMQEFLADAIKGLEPREQTILSLHYYEELTLKEVGGLLNISESRVSQIHSSALKSLERTLKMT